jgi:hypothetical protein
MDGFVAQCGNVRPLYITQDGFDGHFSLMNIWLMALGIYIIWLRSQNSINDQPNDNAINAMIAAGYNERITLYRAQAPGVALTCPVLNQLLSETWNHVKVIAGPSVSRAFLKCGLFPLNRRATNYVNNAQLAVTTGGRGAPQSSGTGRMLEPVPLTETPRTLLTYVQSSLHFHRGECVPIPKQGPFASITTLCHVLIESCTWTQHKIARYP